MALTTFCLTQTNEFSFLFGFKETQVSINILFITHMAIIIKRFLQKVALGAVVCILAACSSLPKDWSGMSTEDIRQWEENGFNAKQAQIWKAAGFAPTEANDANQYRRKSACASAG